MGPHERFAGTSLSGPKTGIKYDIKKDYVLGPQAVPQRSGPIYLAFLLPVGPDRLLAKLIHTAPILFS